MVSRAFLLFVPCLFLLASSAAAQSSSVVSLTLINADTDQPIAAYDPLPNGATLNLATLPTRNLNVRANVTGTVGSVRFALDGNPNFRTENSSPFALAGDSTGNYAAWTPALGQHTLIATPYALANANGSAGTAHQVQFTVVDNNPAVVRINAGGSAFTDSLGRTWAADANFVGTSNTFSTTQAIAGTVDDPLYQSERYGQSFGYQIPVANGTYEVDLHFAEIFWTSAGQRVFDVSLEGALVLNDFDIWSVAGANTAMKMTFVTTVSDGVLTVNLATVVDNAKISAIEVRPTTGGSNQPPTVNAGMDQTITLPNSATLTGTVTDDGLPNGTLTRTWSKVSGPGTVTFGTPTANTTTATFSSAGTYVLRLTASDGALSASDDVTVTVNTSSGGTVVRINAGGSAFTDSLGRTWAADTNFVGTSSTFSTTQAIAGTVDDPLYQSERYGQNFSYQIPVANGTYAVDLHFAEIFWTSAGTRVFDVTLEGALVLNDFDIWSAAGANTALKMTFSTTVADGVLAIAFSTVVDNAKISAIEVRPATGGTNQPPTVSAGPDQTITLPNNATLTGTVTDDGLPTGTLTRNWSKVSGPGTVAFGTPTADTTTATFGSAGTYVLRLTASDGALSASDDVTVTANGSSGGPAVRINAGGSAYTDSLGQTWQADTFFVGTSAVFSTTQPITGTTDDSLYQSERYGQSFSYQIPIANGTYEVDLRFAEIFWTSAGKRVFDVSVEGALVLDNLDIWSEVGKDAALDYTVGATVTDGVLNIQFTGVVDQAKISAISVHSHPGDPFLHVVIDAPKWVVDYDNNGTENVPLRGSDSHTHEIGKQIVSWVWKKGTTTLGTTANIVTPLAVGAHTISLTIGDNNNPPRTLTNSAALDVFPPGSVGGAIARYYLAGGTPLATLLDSPPSTPAFVEVVSPLEITAFGDQIGNSSFTTNVLIVLSGTFQAQTSGTYEFLLQGGSGTRLFIDGLLVTGPKSLSAGAHSLEARFAIPSAASLPASVLVKVNGGPPTVLDKLNTTHSETGLAPFINSVSGSSFAGGGGAITIKGVGFFPSASVEVWWAGQQITNFQVVDAQTLSLTAPPGGGTVLVQVETPNGLSNSASFTYLNGGGTIAFSSKTVATPGAPTQGAFGPDGRLYVGTLTGSILAYTFDDNYNVTNVQTISTIAGLPNNQILGIAFNPFDPPSPVKIYVAHSLLYAQGGACFSGPAPYPGQVSVLTGPNFTVQPLITKLPTSNHDHAVNGLAFDNEGDLLISMGGNTNAGVEDCNMGGLPESPLTAAVLKARISKPGFVGNINYVETASGATNNDQVAGHIVDVANGVDVGVFAHGFRNTFDLVWTTTGALYGTDNGANTGFGPASTSATTQTAVGDQPDELELLVEGHYYGHPNRNRGRRDARQNVFRPPSTGSLLGVHTAQLATFPPSTNGIDEYRSTVFNSALRGNLLVQHWNGELYRTVLAADGLSVTQVESIPGIPTALDVVSGPGGAIVGIDYSHDAIKVSQPTGLASGVQAFDIFPWRARSDGGAQFVIGGTGFGTVGNTSVTIGGQAATILSVSPTRIKGVVPPKSAPTADLLDVVVQSNGSTAVISDAFRYVLPRGVGTGDWTTAPQMPVALGEVAAGVINGVMYIVGHNDNTTATLAYDLAQHVWFNNLPARPFPGDHHAAEVINGKLYLFGGIGGGSEGKVQIFDPSTSTWSTGANIPFATGSASTALINGKVYLAGGIVGASTVASAAVYNPVTNAWSSIASMPLARNHTAAGTDGTRFFVFGGRGPGSGDGNVVAEGFNDTQIYNPATNTWVSSSSSSIAPLPQKRGGMGKAAFLGGEFYVIGGETTPSGTGQVAGNVYNRVDVYDPVSNTWRLDKVIPTARHGIFPLAYDGKIFVAGGGTVAGHSESNVIEVLSR
jgi:N-acetylneuraminic acid mutarotase